MNFYHIVPLFEFVVGSVFLYGSTNLRLKNELKRKDIILRIKDKKKEKDLVFIFKGKNKDKRMFIYYQQRE